MKTESMPLVIMLEDDRDRIDRFSAILANRATLLYWRTADAFIDAYSHLPQIPQLIALDHDLFVDSVGDPDPGDGREVAKYLATQTPIVPVLIHSTNWIAAESMLSTLREAAWNVERIAPIGEDWIEADWYPMVNAKFHIW